MLKLNLYIQSVGFITHAGHSHSAEFGFKQALQQPDYNEFIPPLQQRRMSKAVRMGIGAAKICMQRAGLDRVDAISVGTALGCLNDTEFFLGKMITQEEQMLTPTAFIQSTHNTVAGQIALHINCTGHNLTFVHKANSFAHALIDAALYLGKYPSHCLLVGALDEHTPLTLQLMNEAGVPMNAEGAAFFLVTAKEDANTLACIRSVAFEHTNTNSSPFYDTAYIEAQVGCFPTADASALALLIHQGHKNFSLHHELCQHATLLHLGD